MTARNIVVLGAAIGLGSIVAVGLAGGHAFAQSAPTYRDASPPGAYPPPMYRGGVPQESDDDDGPGPQGLPPPNYRGGPPGTYSSEELPAPSGNPRYGYGRPPNGGPYGAVPNDQDPRYAQPPVGGPYAPPQQQYGAQPYGGQPYDPAPRSGSPDTRPPMGIGPDEQQATVPNRGIQPGPGPEPRISPDQLSSLPPEDRPETDAPRELSPEMRRQLVTYPTREPAGTLIIDTPNTHLYLVLGGGKAMRYGIGVGREGFTWAGVERISRMQEWPDWHPPKEMIERQPYLPRFMAGGLGNPLGARALYLGKTLYRIHGTNQPSTIGTFVSSGCIRLVNEDIEDLYQRVQVGTRVMVLPGGAPPPTASNAK
jgi:lipoprotein-anchoring transpeptidase ErfK/SrfK